MHKLKFPLKFKEKIYEKLNKKQEIPCIETNICQETNLVTPESKSFVHKRKIYCYAYVTYIITYNS